MRFVFSLGHSSSVSLLSNLCLAIFLSYLDVVMLTFPPARAQMTEFLSFFSETGGDGDKGYCFARVIGFGGFMALS